MYRHGACLACEFGRGVEGATGHRSGMPIKCNTKNAVCRFDMSVKSSIDSGSAGPFREALEKRIVFPTIRSVILAEVVRYLVLSSKQQQVPTLFILTLVPLDTSFIFSCHGSMRDIYSIRDYSYRHTYTQTCIHFHTYIFIRTSNVHHLYIRTYPLIYTFCPCLFRATFRTSTIHLLLHRPLRSDHRHSINPQLLLLSSPATPLAPHTRHHHDHHHHHHHYHRYHHHYHLRLFQHVAAP